jgi:hypothetical protein
VRSSAAAGAAELANGTQEDITWYASVLVILLVAVVVMLLRR